MRYDPYAREVRSLRVGGALMVPAIELIGLAVGMSYGNPSLAVQIPSGICGSSLFLMAISLIAKNHPQSSLSPYARHTEMLLGAASAATVTSVVGAFVVATQPDTHTNRQVACFDLGAMVFCTFLSIALGFQSRSNREKRLIEMTPPIITTTSADDQQPTETKGWCARFTACLSSIRTAFEESGLGCCGSGPDNTNEVLLRR